MKKIIDFCKKYSFKIYLSLIFPASICSYMQLFFLLSNKKYSDIFCYIGMSFFTLTILYNLYEKKHKIGYYQKFN